MPVAAFKHRSAYPENVVSFPYATLFVWLFVWKEGRKEEKR